MAPFEIGVHVTNQLYNKHGFTPRDKAAEYIEGPLTKLVVTMLTLSRIIIGYMRQ